jgi:hypothetical protein
MSFEIDGRAIPSSAFEDLLALAKFVQDMKTYGRRLEHLSAEVVKADARIAAAEKAETEAKHAQAEAERAKAALADREVESATRLAAVQEREAGLRDIQRDIRQASDRFKREILNYSGFAEHFNEKLQSLPSWDALAQMVLGKQSDANYDDASASRAETENETLPPDNLVLGSTLTNSRPKPARLRH